MHGGEGDLVKEWRGSVCDPRVPGWRADSKTCYLTKRRIFLLQRAKEAVEVVGRNTAIWRIISGGRSSNVVTPDIDIPTWSASCRAGISDFSIGELARVVSAHSSGTWCKRRKIEG